MRLVKVEVKDFNGRCYKRTKLDEIIDEFIAMNTAVVELNGWEQTYSTAYSCHASLTTALKRRGYNHIKVTTKEGVPYLIDMNLMDKEV
jgi:hypothetical protein